MIVKAVSRSDITADYVIAGLEEGAITLMALPMTVGPNGYASQSAGFGSGAERKYTILDLFRSFVPDGETDIDIASGAKDCGKNYGNVGGKSDNAGGLVKLPSPSPTALTRVDRIVCWLSLIPNDQQVLRRIVGARSLKNPRTGQYLFSWRKIAKRLGADHKAIQRWHGQGIKVLVSQLSQRQDLWV